MPRAICAGNTSRSPRRRSSGCAPPACRPVHRRWKPASAATCRTICDRPTPTYDPGSAVSAFDPVAGADRAVRDPLVRARLHRRAGAGLAAAAAPGAARAAGRDRRSRPTTSSPGRRSASCWADGSATCCSTSPELYLQHPAMILPVWQGGMSFHGGMLGVVVAILWFCRANASASWALPTASRCARRSGSGSGGSPISSMASCGDGRRPNGCRSPMIYPQGRPAAAPPQRADRGAAGRA